MTHCRTTFRFAVIAFTAAAVSACGRPLGSDLPVILEPTLHPTASAGSPVPSAPATSSGEKGASVIFHNGQILTMDDALPTASAIHIRGERIVAVGDEATILAEASAQTLVIDLGGRTLMPGFVDAHSHMFEEPDMAAAQEDSRPNRRDDDCRHVRRSPAASAADRPRSGRRPAPPAQRVPPVQHELRRTARRVVAGLPFHPRSGRDAAHRRREGLHRRRVVQRAGGDLRVRQRRRAWRPVFHPDPTRRRPASHRRLRAPGGGARHRGQGSGYRPGGVRESVGRRQSTAAPHRTQRRHTPGPVDALQRRPTGDGDLRPVRHMPQTGGRNAPSSTRSRRHSAPGNGRGAT